MKQAIKRVLENGQRLAAHALEWTQGVIDRTAAIAGNHANTLAAKVTLLTPIGHYALIGGFAASAVFIFITAFELAHNTYSGSSGGIDAVLTAHCLARGTLEKEQTPVTILSLGNGRFRIGVDKFNGQDIELDVELKEPATPKVLVLRNDSASNLKVAVSGESGEPLTESAVALEAGPLRSLIPLPGLLSLQHLKVKISSANKPKEPFPLVLKEIGLFKSDDGLRGDCRFFLHYYNDRDYYNEMLPLILFTFGAAFVLIIPIFGRRSGLYGALFIVGLTLCTGGLCLRLGYYFNDLRMTVASGQMQEGAGSNLNYGTCMGSNLLLGNGPVLIPGSPPWHRMPGYAFVTALAGLLSFTATDHLLISINTIMLQLLLVALANGFFFWAATRIMRVWVAAFLGVFFAFLPNQFIFTQIETVMPAVVLYLLGIICLYVARKAQDEPILIRHDLLLHSGFALWFFIRPDIVPCWALVSLALHWRKVSRLFIPLCLFLAIGCSWGIFKYRYTHEFVMSTNSFGASAMVGLLEVPNQFKWELSDGGYWEWMKESGHATTSSADNSYATRQVFRFWLTFPGYMISLLWHRLLNFVYLQSWPGWSVNYNNLPFIGAMRGTFVWLLFGILATSLAIGYKRLQTFLLGSLVLFNLPVFFLVYSSGGRFYNGIGYSLLACTLPLVFEVDFYRQIGKHRVIAAGICFSLLLASIWGTRLDNYLLKCDRFRYSSPFLDPHGCESLLKFKGEAPLKSLSFSSAQLPAPK